MKINWTMNDKALNTHLSRMPGVQGELDRVIFEAKVRAQEDLLEHRAEGHAEITTERGRVDRYLILSDERGQKAAAAIEYGRNAYEVRRPDGSTYRVSAMEGLFILHKALKLKRGR